MKGEERRDTRDGRLADARKSPLCQEVESPVAAETDCAALSPLARGDRQYGGEGRLAINSTFHPASSILWK